VPDLVLDPGEQAALTSLLRAEPVPGVPLPERRVLELLERLIPCDAVGGSHYDREGVLLASVEVSRRRTGGNGEAASVSADIIQVSFRNEGGQVVELCLRRGGRPFDERDGALLAILAPVLQRLVRERPSPTFPEALTPQERRVLTLVAAGMSNAEIGHRLSISTSTVRKHLEHAYRKLGVTGRLGAVAALQGRDRPGLDLRGRVERFA
jgi:DNA-binding CsgD family transcriptional regulator